MSKEKIYELFGLGESNSCLVEILRSFQLPTILKEVKKEFEEEGRDLEENRVDFIDIVRQRLSKAKKLISNVY